jgi:hypothetical protein
MSFASLANALRHQKMLPSCYFPLLQLKLQLEIQLNSLVTLKSESRPFVDQGSCESPGFAIVPGEAAEKAWHLNEIADEVIQTVATAFRPAVHNYIFECTYLIEINLQMPNTRV